MNDLIYRQDAIDTVMKHGKRIPTYVIMCKDALKKLPSAEPEIEEKLYQYKCYITDNEGLQHEVIHIDDIRRVTG